MGPEVAARLRRHAAELSNAIGRSGSSSEEAGDLQEVISTRGMMSLRTPYWSVSVIFSNCTIVYVFQDV